MKRLRRPGPCPPPRSERAPSQTGRGRRRLPVRLQQRPLHGGVLLLRHRQHRAIRHGHGEAPDVPDMIGVDEIPAVDAQKQVGIRALDDGQGLRRGDDAIPHIDGGVLAVVGALQKVDAAGGEEVGGPVRAPQGQVPVLPGREGDGSDQRLRMDGIDGVQLVLAVRVGGVGHQDAGLPAGTVHRPLHPGQVQPLKNGLLLAAGIVDGERVGEHHLGGLPADAQLAVSEVPQDTEAYADYIARGAEPLGVDADSLTFLRVFDISILDPATGEHCQPETEVTVTIRLLQDTVDSQVSVVHFGAEAEVLDADVEGDAVRFQTSGLSAYAIVPGPGEVPLGWSKITTLDELRSFAQEGKGLYIGHTDGYYLKNSTYAVTDTRTGITKTKPAQTYPTDAATLYYFEPVEGTTDRFKIYCYNGENKQYVIQTTNSLNFTADEVAATAFTAKLFVPNDSDASLWTFRWIDNNYYLTATVDDSTRYLKITASGLSLVNTPDDSCKIQVVPGTGTHAGQICLKAGNTTLTYSGTASGGFSVGGSAGSEWLYLVGASELTSDYFLTYSASKVSVSDKSVENGSRIIVYTRAWDDVKKKYVFYAIDHDGTLVPCYESGDSIQWIGGQINTMLWNLVEYYWEGTNDPNEFYERYNQYSEQYIALQIEGGQILSASTIGINLTGRKNGYYYSPILVWDDKNYTYTGLKVENGKAIPCTSGEADDFYFAVMQDLPVDDTLTTVPTVDHTQYGITMKLVDFSTIKKYDNSTTTEEQHTVLGDSRYVAQEDVQGLLSTDLGADGYPTAVKMNKSLKELFKNAQEVNHLFIGSTYSGSGYYEYDSTQNFAHLITAEEAKKLDDPSLANTFRVYKELGTMDGENKSSLKHGQFMPYNDLEAGVFASVNPKNLYSATLAQLPNSDPRKYEQMYLVRNPNYYFGVEIEASFTQTANGLDAWGHDIIYEFTGDDDFWLYVDGELIIDLGGIHSALPGSVNYSTGEVNVNKKETTLRALFEKNYRARNPNAADGEVNEYLAQYFDEGSTIFKDYTTHTMRIFFMERGAGASNLHMRFNLASVKPGTVLLSKELSGVDAVESVLAEYPYQIFYRLPGDEGGKSHRAPAEPQRRRIHPGGLQGLHQARDLSRQLHHPGHNAYL